MWGEYNRSHRFGHTEEDFHNYIENKYKEFLYKERGQKLKRILHKV